ncbi:MAG TPA: hypothetical protein VHN79_03985 [Lacunisphaera sp.]|nr:hypothetical protein [Lacunisphaera sp.]
MKTARFKQVVAKCGRPEVHLSFSRPAKDEVLQKAAAANRLLTVQQESRGGKKDHGAVGLHPGKSVQYLLFPKSLRAYLGRNIVGIDYALLAEEVSASPPDQAPRRDRPAKAPAEKRARGGTDARRRAKKEKEPSPRSSRPKPIPESPEPVVPRVRPWIEEVEAAVSELKAGQNAKALGRLRALLGRERN